MNGNCLKLRHEIYKDALQIYKKNNSHTIGFCYSLFHACSNIGIFLSFEDVMRHFPEINKYNPHKYDIYCMWVFENKDATKERIRIFEEAILKTKTN